MTTFKLLRDHERAGMPADDIRAWNSALKFISEASAPMTAKVTVDGALIVSLEKFMRRALDGKHPAPPPEAAPAPVPPTTNEFIL